MGRLKEMAVGVVAKARAYSKILWAIFIAAGGLLVALLLTRRRLPMQTERHVHDIMATRREKTEAAKAEAAIRIEAARSKERALKETLKAVMSDPDGPRRRRRLIEMNATIDASRACPHCGLIGGAHDPACVEVEK